LDIYKSLTIKICFLAFLAFSISACKSKKVLKAGELTNRSEKELLQAIEKHNIDCDFLSAKAKLHFKNEYESGTAKVNVRIAKDSLIWMNVKKLGIEIARTLIRPDSVFIVYRFEKAYEQGAAHQFNSAYGLSLDFDLLQSFLIGNVNAPKAIESKELIEGLYQVISQSEEYKTTHKMDPVSLKIKSYKLVDLNGQTMSTEFSNYEKLESGEEISMNRSYISTSDYGGTTEALIKISSYELNNPKEIKFEIPKHYTEL